MEIVPIKQAVNERVAVAFSDLKDIIETGEVVSIAFTVVRHDGSMDSGWSGDRAASLLGSLNRLSHRINIAMDGQ